MTSLQFPFAKLLLIRHGQARSTDGLYNDETPLSTLGQLQATRVAERLITRSPAVVYASPYRRALETAKPLCQALSLEPIVDPRLAEFEFGPASLASIEERPDLLLWHSTHRAVEDGENLGEFMRRVTEILEEIVEQHQNESVAIFAHAGTLDAAIRWAVGFTPDNIWQHEFNLANASITEIDYWPRGNITGGPPRYASIQRTGDVAHLDGLVTVL